MGQEIGSPNGAGPIMAVGGSWYTGAAINLVSAVETSVPYTTVMPNFSDGIEDIANKAIKAPADGFYDILSDDKKFSNKILKRGRTDLKK